MPLRHMMLCTLMLCFAATAVASEKVPAFDGLFKAKVTEEGAKFRWAPKDKNLTLTYRLSRCPIEEQDNYALVAEKKRLTRGEIIETFGEDFFTSVRPLIFPMEMVETLEEKFAVANMMEEQAGMLLFVTDLRFRLALSMGLGHEEKAMESGKTWIYRLEAFDGKELIGTSYQRIRMGSPAKARTITGQGVTYDWGAALRWSDYRKYTAFNVYRSEASETGYKKITATPVYVATRVDESKRIVTAPYFYSDTTAEKGKIYHYKVSGVDLFGDESPLSLAIFPVRDQSRRPAPMLPVALIQKEETIHVSWAAAEDLEVAGYNLYRGNAYDDPFIKLNGLPLDATTYADKAIQLGSNYFYSVTSVRENGTESVMSLPRLLAPRDITPPAMPAKLTGTAQRVKGTPTSAVRLTWFPNTEPDLAGYHIFKATRVDALDWAKLNNAPIQAPYITDTMDKALDKKPYFYKVKAMDKAGNPSPFSDIIAITLPDVTAPPAPSWKDFENKETGITLSWNPLLIDDLAGYRVLRGRGNRQKILASIAADQTHFTDTTATPGTACRYQVVAFDRAGNASTPSPVLTLKALDKTPPTITAFKATVVNGQVLVTATIPDADFKALTLFRKRGGEFAPITAMTPSKEITDKRVDKGKTYVYKIIAYDASGNTQKSQSVEITVPK